jgi:biotin-dependent carboxylase-like uncharacterized protein
VTRTIEILRPGALSTIQDLGRPGHGHLAVPPSGALDPPAHRLANRLVGNQESAATIETTVDGIALRANALCHVAVTGALAPVTVDDTAASWAMPLLLRPGQVLNIGRPTHGLRNYVAISGGVASPVLLGSRATDMLSALGPAVLRTGAILPLGPTAEAPPAIDFAPYPVPSGDVLTLRLYPGPRTDWITRSSLNQVAQTTWTVSPASNRVGLRLDGPPLQRAITRELPSEGVVLGSLQIPPDGHPVLFLADHPTTGGYPIIGVVPPQDLSHCAQSVPGAAVRFVHCRPDAWG